MENLIKTVTENKEITLLIISILMFAFSEIKAITKSKRNSIILELLIDILKKFKFFLIKKK